MTSKREVLILLLVVMAGLFFRIYNVNDWTVLWDGASRSLCAINMMESGNWWPAGAYNPPVFHYLLVVSFSIFGACDFAARIPSVIVGTLSILVTYFLGKNLYGDTRVGLLSAFLAASSSLLVRFDRDVYYETLSVFFLCLSALYAHKASAEDRRHLMLCALFLGLAIWAKRTSILILPALAVYVIVSEKSDFFREKEVYLSVFILSVFLCPMVFKLIETNFTIFLWEIKFGQPLPSAIVSQWEYALLTLLFYGGPTMLVGGIAMIYGYYKGQSEDIMLLLWAASFLIFHIFVWRHHWGQYYIPIALPLYILSSRIAIDSYQEVTSHTSLFRHIIPRISSSPRNTSYDKLSKRVLVTLVFVLLASGLSYDLYTVFTSIQQCQGPVNLMPARKAIDWLETHVTQSDVILVPNAIPSALGDFPQEESLEFLFYLGMFRFYLYGKCTVEKLYHFNGDVNVELLKQDRTRYVVVIPRVEELWGVGSGDGNYEDITKNEIFLRCYRLIKNFDDSCLIYQKIAGIV